MRSSEKWDEFYKNRLVEFRGALVDRFVKLRQYNNERKYPDKDIVDVLNEMNYFSDGRVTEVVMRWSDKVTVNVVFFDFNKGKSEESRDVKWEEFILELLVYRKVLE